MAGLFIDKNKCTLCGVCLDTCPFGALHNNEGTIEVDAGCKMCRICIKKCPEQAIFIKEEEKILDKGKWKGILVYAEYFEGKVHPVTYELIGIAQKLAGKVKMPVYCILIGGSSGNVPGDLREYGVDRVFVYENEKLLRFCVDIYANMFENLINEIKPSVVLVGSTSIGRSLAPRVAARLRTGLTADCTTLDIRENTDLVQIRPAFGGNIMAQIITPESRPQFATVRYKVMDRAEKQAPHGGIVYKKIKEEMLESGIEVINVIKKGETVSITDSEVLVVAGQGIKGKKDLHLIKKLAHLLGGEYAATRPLVEKGWADYTRQIGLSGRTVKPKLIITCGVSGAIQFTACMDSSECIVAINSDKNAPIFKIAQYGITGDLYEIIPRLMDLIERRKSNEVQ